MLHAQCSTLLDTYEIRVTGQIESLTLMYGSPNDYAIFDLFGLPLIQYQRAYSQVSVNATSDAGYPTWKTTLYQGDCKWRTR